LKTVNIFDAKTNLSALLVDVERGEEVVIARNGTPIAKLVRLEAPRIRERGAWRKFPGWENYVYDATLFAPMSDEELRQEGWPVD
jgi:prevent-host-death family protein